MHTLAGIPLRDNEVREVHDNLYRWMGNLKERCCMSASVFEYLMAVSLGALAGTGIGLFIGFAAKQQRNDWSAMTRKEKTLTIALVLIFSAVCIAGLARYMFP